MNGPIPFKVAESGELPGAPAGSIPIALYGAGSSAPDEISSPSGGSTARVEDRGLFKAEVTTPNGQGILRVEDISGTLSALLTDEDNNPLTTDWSPSGIVVHQDLDIRIPKAPLTGNYVLKSADGVVSWVEETP